MKGTDRWDGRPVIFQHVIRSTAHCTHSIIVVRYVFKGVSVYLANS